MGQVSLRNIRKSYGATEVIRGVDIDVKDGEFLVFVGPSGCGKSTTLRMIAGLEEISGGELFIDGVCVNDLRPSERGAAMVFQSYALYPHMTVAENMAFSLKMNGVSKTERAAQVSRVAEVLRITDLLDRLPKDLSGGQRQRVAIGRAIVRKPKVFLFDEPLSNLDAALRVGMRIELTRLHAELGSTMIYVTHDQVEAMTMGDRIAVFNKGAVEQIGAPMELYNQPANEFVATFLGSPRINLLSRPDAAASDEHKALWRLATSEKCASAERVGIRPEHVQVVAVQEGVAAKVVLSEHLGDSSILHLQIEGLQEPLIAKLGADGPLVEHGQDVGVSLDARRVLGFAVDGKALIQ